MQMKNVFRYVCKGEYDGCIIDWIPYKTQTTERYIQGISIRDDRPFCPDIHHVNFVDAWNMEIVTYEYLED